MLIGRSSISSGLSASSLSTSAEQACRTRPLMSIVQRAADFFQAVAVLGDGRHVLAVDRLGLGGDPLQHADDVHVRLVLEPVPLPVAGLAGAVLPQHADFERRGGLRA